MPRCIVGGGPGANRSEPSLSSDLKVAQSSRLPGGDLVSAVLDREVMGLADRGETVTPELLLRRFDPRELPREPWIVRPDRLLG